MSGESAQENTKLLPKLFQAASFDDLVTVNTDFLIALSAVAEDLTGRDEFPRFVEARVDSRGTAEDILQSAFVRGMEKESTLRDEESAVAWFYRLPRNAVIDHYRSQGSVSRLFEQWPEGLDMADEPVEFVKNEICRCVGQKLDQKFQGTLENPREH